jgi:hypothetical protein
VAEPLLDLANLEQEQLAQVVEPAQPAQWITMAALATVDELEGSGSPPEQRKC